MIDSLMIQSMKKRADALHDRAAALNKAANHETVRAEVDRTILTITEGEAWLERAPIHKSSAMLQIASFQLEAANARLDMIDEWLATYGPDGQLIY